MERIKLSKSCKEILLALKNKTFDDNTEFDDNSVIYLSTIGFIEVIKTTCGNIVTGFTDIGEAYLYSNPRLKDPSIWDDKKYWINTAISLIALIVAIIALFKD